MLLDKVTCIGLKFWSDIALVKSKTEEKVEYAAIKPTCVAAEVEYYTVMLDCYKKYVNEEESKRNFFIAKQKDQFRAYESKSTKLDNTVALKIAEAEHESTASKSNIHRAFLEKKAKLELKMKELETTYNSEINAEDRQFELFKLKVKDEANDTLKFCLEEMHKIHRDVTRSEERKKEDLTKPKALIKIVELFHELLQLRAGSVSRNNIEQKRMEKEADDIRTQLYTVMQPVYKSGEVDKIIDHILNYNSLHDKEIQDIKH
jgi:hypothetical protein